MDLISEVDSKETTIPPAFDFCDIAAIEVLTRVLFQTFSELNAMFLEYTNASGVPPSSVFSNAVDAVWTAALALHNSVEPVRAKLNR